MYATLDSYVVFHEEKKEHYEALDKGCFMFVYIGTLRDYMKDAIKQVHLWNPSTPIYACVSRLEENKKYIREFEEYPTVKTIYLEDLPSTPHHDQFHKQYQNLSMNKFWKYAMERFFYVEECMKTHGLRDVFHHEFDNMVYFRTDDMVPRCASKNKLLVPSDNEVRFIAGSCYIPSADHLTPLNQYFSKNARNQNEMEMMMDFYKHHPDKMEGLPVVPPEYSHVLKPIEGSIVSRPSRLSETVPHFQGVFDAAAIGQYFGGIDPIHNPNNSDGFISTHSAFQVDKLNFQWRKVDGLYQPWMSADKVHWYPIYNLHIHNKHMTRWISDVTEMKAHLSTITVV